MRKIKKVLAGAVAALATLAAGAIGASTASAADSSTILAKDMGSASMEVDGNEDLTGHTFVAVELAKYTSAVTDNATPTAHITSYDVSTPSSLKTAITDAVNASHGTLSVTDLDSTNPMEWVVKNYAQPDSTASPWQGRLRDFLDNLKNTSAFKTALGNSPTYNGHVLKIDQNDKTKATVNNLEPGIYAIVDETPATKTTTTLTDGRTKTTVQNAAIIAMYGTAIKGISQIVNGSGKVVADKLGHVDYKGSSESTVTKANITPSGTHGQSADDGTSGAASIGHTVTYRLSTQIPNWAGYDHYYLALLDTPSNGLTFDGKTNVHAYITDSKWTSRTAPERAKELTQATHNTGESNADGDYEVDTQNDSSKITFLFGKPYNNGTTAAPSWTRDIVSDSSTFPVGKYLTVTYTMTINGHALEKNALTNSADINYSHNPGDWTQHSSNPGSNPTLYTGKVVFLKTDMNNKTLSGVTFHLTEKDTSDTKDNDLGVVKISDGDYRLADNTENTEKTKPNGYTTVLTTNTDGKITLEGVDGPYELHEVDSTIGAPILANVDFNVNVDQKTGASTVPISDVSEINHLASVDAQNGDQIDVLNAHNIAEMPKTGAAGIAFYIILALILIGAGVAIAFATKRNRQTVQSR